MTETPDVPDPRDFTDASPAPGRDADLAAVCGALQGLGVTRAVVHYDGCGDSGCIEEVAYRPGGVAVPRRLEGRLRDVAEGYCPDGYATGDGGDGSLTVYPALGVAELEHCDRYEDAVAADVPAAPLPDALRRRLTGRGITRVTARFDGCGDSGQVEELTAEPDPAALDDPLAQALEDFLLGLLPGGWEINEGGYGELAVDVATGRAEADAYWRVAKDSETRVTRWRWRR
jgi:hypothetical protein